MSIMVCSTDAGRLSLSFQIGSLFSVVAVWYLFIQEKLKFTILPLSSLPLHICLQCGYLSYPVVLQIVQFMVFRLVLW